MSKWCLSQIQGKGVSAVRLKLRSDLLCDLSSSTTPPIDDCCLKLLAETETFSLAMALTLDIVILDCGLQQHEAPPKSLDELPTLESLQDEIKHFCALNGVLTAKRNIGDLMALTPT